MAGKLGFGKKEKKEKKDEPLGEFLCEDDNKQKPEEVKEYVAVGVKVDSFPAPTSKSEQKKSYIDTRLENEQNNLNTTMDALKSIQASVQRSQRVIKVLRYVEDSKYAIDVKWLINEIGTIKTTSEMDGERKVTAVIIALESTILKHIEKIMDKDTKGNMFNNPG